MSSSIMRTGTSEHANAAADNVEWRKEVEALQASLASEAKILRLSVPPRGRPACEEIANQAPGIMKKILELERLQQGRLDRIGRGETLEDLDRTIEEVRNELTQQQDAKSRLQEEYTLLAHQRIDAQEKLDAIVGASEQREWETRQENLRHDQQAAALDTRQQEVEAREAILITSNQTLSQNLQDLAKREDDNKKKSAKIIRRFDILADYKEHKDREVTELTSRYEALEIENNGLKIAKKELEDRVGPLQSQLETSNKEKEQLVKSNVERSTRLTGLDSQIRVIKTKLTDAEASQRQSMNDVANLESVVTRLEGTVETQNTRLGSLSDTEAQVAKLSSSLTHLSAVILPEKQAEIANLKAELQRERELANTYQNDSAGRISRLNTKRLELEASIRERDAQLSHLRQEKESIHAVATKSTEEADSTKTQLAEAQAKIDSLNTAWNDNHLLLIRNGELEATATTCESEHSDIDQVRQRILDLEQQNEELRGRRIDTDNAKRLQDTVISEYARIRKEHEDLEEKNDELEQQRNELQQRHDGLRLECNRLRQERDGIRQARDGLQRTLNELRDQAGTDLDLHIAALAEKERTIEDVRRELESSEKERDELDDECNRKFAENVRLTTEVAHIRDEKAILVKDSEHLLNTANDTNAHLERLTARLQSCHCFDESTSRKRTHDQMDLSGEGASSSGHVGRTQRRLGKTPESRFDLNAAGPSNAGDSSERPVSPGRLGVEDQDDSNPAGPGMDGARRTMNTTATRALGTANATITPSDGVAFVILVKDAKLLNFSSDVLPVEVLQTLRRRFRDWNSRSKFNWDSVQALLLSRSCIEARSDKRKSSWDDGTEYACDLCENKRRLCMVVQSAGQVLLLPRKAAEDEGRGPADILSWMK